MKRIGFGQVEPNHLSAQRNGQVYAQLPANADIAVLENGQFVKYDYANGEVNFTGDGEWMLVMNEVKLYDGRETYKDFAQRKSNYDKGEMVPRVLKTSVGDIYTTNTIGVAGAYRQEVDMGAVALNDLLAVNANGYLAVNANPADGDLVFKVVKVYTMPDGQEGVKVQRIK